MGKRNKKQSKLSKKDLSLNKDNVLKAADKNGNAHVVPKTPQNQESSLPKKKPGGARMPQSSGKNLPSDAGRALDATKSSNGSRKPQMPSPSAVGNARRGGLGRGLASLIPTGPSRPSLGDGAADIVLGSGSGNGADTRGSDTDARLRTGGTDGQSGESTVGAQTRSADSETGRTDSDISTIERTGNAREGNPGMEPKRHSAVSVSGTHRTGGLAGEVTEDRSSTANVSNVSRETSDENFGATYQELALDAIRANAKQPREVFDEEALQELVHSIKEFGLMQPIVVRKAPDEGSTYELIMGERRLRAAKRAGFELIPAIVRETADDEMLRDALLENIHRVQLNPLEEAAAYQQLMEEFGVTQEQLAKKIGRSRPLITNMIRLLQLPVSVQRRVGAGVLSAGHARALLGLKSGADEQEKLATRVVSEGLSVRATEEAVTLLNRGDTASNGTKPSGRKPQQLPEEVSNWVDNASDALETKVSVQMGKKKGKIVVEFGGPEDFDRIIELLNFKKH